MSIEHHELEFPSVAEEQPELSNVNGSSVPMPSEPDQPAAIPQPAENWHAKAGRKGAQRIHQLIEAGKLYEKEHGLKPGRQTAPPVDCGRQAL